MIGIEGMKRIRAEFSHRVRPNRDDYRGKLASPIVLFENERYGICAYHTRFLALEWCVWDYSNADDPKVIRQDTSMEAALVGFM